MFGLHTYEVLAGGKAILAVFDDPEAAGESVAFVWAGQGTGVAALWALAELNTAFN